MNGSPVLLDTSVIVAHFRPPGRHGEAIERHALHVPEIVVAELYAGALRSARPVHHRRVVDDFLKSAILMRCDLETVQVYAQLWNQLASAGSLIPHNDIWIAALAIQHGLPLVTHDTHFEKVQGLRVERW